MTRTVVALYDSFQDANSAVHELVDNGFSRDDISLMAGDTKGEYSRYLGGSQDRVETTDVSGASQGAGVGASIGAALGGIGGLLVGLGVLVIPGIGPVLAAGPLSAALAGLAGAGAGAIAGGVTGGLIGALVDVGVPEETAQYYSEGIRRGGTLLTVRTDDNMSSQAVNIMNRHNPIDINSRAAQWREQGWTGFNANEPMEHHSTVDQNIPTTGQQNQPYGGMGVTGQDRGSTGFGGGETRGQMDLNSQDRMAHPDTTSSSVTGTDYNSTRMDSDRNAMGPDYGVTTGHGDFNTYDLDFQNHFMTTYGSTYTYEEFRPAYRYGYDLASDARYQNRNWEDVEPEARRYWDERQPGAWDRFKDAIHHAWDDVKGITH